MSTRTVSRLVGRVFRNRCFTWSILAILLALLLVEWQSQRGYRQTLTAIESALAGRDSANPLRTDEAERLLHGWAWQYTEAHGGSGYVGYRWPSLFRTYRIWLRAVGVWLPSSAGQVTGAVITGEFTTDKLPIVPRQALPPNREVPAQPSQYTFDLSKLAGAVINTQYPDPSGFAQSSLGKLFAKCHKIYYQNPGKPKATDEFIEALQSAAGELPALELSANPQEATWNHLKVFEGGIPFSAFRFSSMMDQPADLSWVFTGEESGVNWYILPARGSMSGFKDFRWSHFPRFQNPSVPCHETAYFQTLGGGEIKPGEDYIVYFAKLRTATPGRNPLRPKYASLGLSIALRLLPTGCFSPNPAAFEIAELVGTPLYSSPGGEILCRGQTPVPRILPTPNANELILCDRESTFRRWDLATKSIVREFHTEAAGNFRCAAISEDGKRLATADDVNFDVLIWDLESLDNQNPIKKVFVPWNGKEKKGGEGSGRVVVDMAFLKNRESLFVDLADDRGERWREAAQWSIAEDREIRRTFLGQNLATAPIAILGGEQLMVARHSGDPQKEDEQRTQWKFEVAFLDAATGETKAVIPLGKLWAFGKLFLSPDEELVTLSMRDALIVLDCATKKVIHRISTTSMGRAEGELNGLSVAWSPDSQLLAIACPDSSIQVWDIRQDRLVRTWCGHAETIRSLAFTSDGKWLASSSNDRTVRLWPREPSNLEIVTNSVGMKLIPLPEGELLMGTPYSESHFGTELPPQEPQHRVRITRPFYMGMHEVTVKQFRKFVEATNYKTTAETNRVGGSHILGSSGSWTSKPEFTWRSPGFPQTDDHPVVQVSWEDAQAFCKWLSDQEQAVYRLPTEAEWEYASRSEHSSVRDQSNTRFRWEQDSRPAQVYGNVADQALREHYKAYGAMPHHDGFAFTAPVGSFAPNLFGLYDMHGNVFEWCADWYDPLYYKSSPAIDPQGPMDGNVRVQRGGGFSHHAGFSRCDVRDYGEPKQVQSGLGFRVVREIAPPTNSKPDLN